MFYLFANFLRLFTAVHSAGCLIQTTQDPFDQGFTNKGSPPTKCAFRHAPTGARLIRPYKNHSTEFRPYDRHRAAGSISVARSNARSCAPIIAMATATPRPRCPPRGAANLSLHASLKFIKAMRPTGEASNPYLAMSFAVFAQSAVRHPPSFIGFAAPPRRASGSGVRGSAAVTGRFRGWKLVVSGSQSKRFFRRLTSPANPVRAQCGTHITPI